MISIQGRVARAIGLTTFADITDALLVLPEGLTRDGLLFDGDLTDEQLEAIWRRMTSRDDADQEERAALEAAMYAGATNLAEMATAYRLGLPVPDAMLPQT